MLMHTKFQTPEVTTDFQTIHDQKFNPSGQPYTGEHATLKRKAETSEQKPNAEEIPSVTGAPDTKENILAERNNTFVVESPWPRVTLVHKRIIMVPRQKLTTLLTPTYHRR